MASSPSARTQFLRSARHLLLGSVGASALMALSVLMLPRFVAKDTYGYWQLYLLYATYLGYVSFGFADGLFLRYSGQPLEAVPRRAVSTHVWALTMVSGLVMGAMAAVAVLADPGQERTWVLCLVALSTVIYLVRSLLTFVYQAAGRAELFARASVLERLVALLGILALVALGYRGLAGFLWADVAGRAAGLAYSAAVARDMVLAPPLRGREARRELGESFRGGIFISLAAIATVLVTAVARFAAERGYSIELFAQIALGFSLVNIVQTLVTPIGLAVLPSIKTRSVEEQSGYYQRGLRLLMPLLVLSLAAAPPILLAARLWLPAYAELPGFFVLMLPMVIFESRTRILAIPFLQSLRRERLLAAANGASLALAVVLAWLSVLAGDARLTVLSLTVVVVLRALVLERLTRTRLGVPLRPATVAETALAAGFCACAFATASWWAWAAFALAWVAYLVWQRDVFRGLAAPLLRRLGR